MVVTFSTGEARLLDAYDLIRMEAFGPLSDEEVFKGFSIKSGVLCWLDGAIDIAPEGLYEISYDYEPPPTTI